MTYKAKHQCPALHCTALTISRYCPIHTPEHVKAAKADRDRYDETRRSNPALAKAADIRNTIRWRKFARWFRATHPLCYNPFGVHAGPVPMQEVHHIVPLRDAPELAFKESNCMSLCIRCHKRIEMNSGTESRGALSTRQSSHLLK